MNQGNPQGAFLRQVAHNISQGASQGDRSAHGGGVNRPPGPHGHAAVSVPRQGHGRGHRTDGEEPAAKADQQGAGPEQQGGFRWRRENDGGKGKDPDHGTESRQAMGILPSRQEPRRQRQAKQSAAREHSR